MIATDLIIERFEKIEELKLPDEGRASEVLIDFISGNFQLRPPKL